MTGTEMFDAIAHIDEDLIEGCLSRMKARSSERRAHAEKTEPGDENKTSERRRTVLAFAALAAAIVLVIGFVSIMHIGRESPKPIGPGVTDTPTPTEDAGGLPVPADNSRISVSEGPRAVFVQGGRLYALFGDNTDNVFGDVDTVLEAYSPADGAEGMLFNAVKEPQLIETHVMQAVLFASGTREEYFYTEGNPFSCLLCVKTDGSLWVRGSNPGGAFGSADTLSGVKLYDNVRKVIVGESCVFALTENGDYLKWTAGAASEDGSPVLIADGVADGGGDNFYLTEDGKLYAFNGEDRALLADNVRSFAVDANKVIAVLNDGSAKLFTLEMGSMYGGKLLFTEDEYIETGVAYCGISGSAAFVVKENGALLSPGGYFAWNNGWSRSLDNVESAYAEGGSIYAITKDGTLHRIDPDVTIAQNVSFCRPMAGSEGCLYETKDGMLHRYSPSGGTEDIVLPGAPAPTAPEGYNEHDYNALRAFLETESDGRKNGEKLSSWYDPDHPVTWTYWNDAAELAKWDEDGYLIEVNALVDSYGLTGALDLSGCERLDKVTFSSQSVDTLDLTGCPLMKGVWLQNCALTRLLPDPIVTPRLLASNTGLKHLHWIAIPDEEMNGNRLDFDLTLDARGEGSVGVWMSEVLENPEVSIGYFNAKGWHFAGWSDKYGLPVTDLTPFTYAWFFGPEGAGKTLTGTYAFTASFEEGSPVFEHVSNSEAYTDAVMRLMNGEKADDSIWDIESCDVYFRLDDDALRAYARVTEHLPENIGDDYVFEYLDPIAEYPREVGEAALKRLYLEIPEECGFEGAYSGVGKTAEGFAGKDWFMLKTVDDTIQDIQFHCIFVKGADGSFNEIDANDKQMHTLVYGALMLNEKEGYIGYGGKNLSDPDDTYRKIYLFRTDDGGRTWKDVGLVIPEEYGSPYPGCVLSPVFDGDHGAMLVIASRLDVPEFTPWEEARLTLWYETFDGGRTWTLHDEKES